MTFSFAYLFISLQDVQNWNFKKTVDLKWNYSQAGMKKKYIVRFADLITDLFMFMVYLIIIGANHFELSRQICIL
jgi:hypothetical protein